MAITRLIFCFLLFTSSQSYGSSKLPFLTSINSLEKFESFSFEPGGYIKLGRSIKVLIDNRKKNDPKIFFINRF